MALFLGHWEQRPGPFFSSSAHSPHEQKSQCAFLKRHAEAVEQYYYKYFSGHLPFFTCSDFHIISQLILLQTHIYCIHMVWKYRAVLQESGIDECFIWSLNLWICYTGRHTMLWSDYHCSFLVSVFLMLFLIYFFKLDGNYVSYIHYIQRKRFFFVKKKKSMWR